MSRRASLTAWEIDWLVSRARKAEEKAKAKLALALKEAERAEMERAVGRLRELRYKLEGLDR